ncbi:MAG: hypothetical protein PHE53_02715 [Thermoguttaceae bacterium]|nr:hypothetical protein [Thermoguttaceae bacterium]
MASDLPKITHEIPTAETAPAVAGPQDSPFLRINHHKAYSAQNCHRTVGTLDIFAEKEFATCEREYGFPFEDKNVITDKGAGFRDLFGLTQVN